MANNRLRIAFMGTPDFAASALQALLQTDHEIVCVYSQPPRPKGRGHQVQPSPVHDLAEKNGIPVFTPKSLKGIEEQTEFAAHNLDVAIVAAYGLILLEEILNAPKYGCLNIHASILPRWRGASPIQQAIWAGDTESGVTIMQMEKGLDTGPMILKRTTPITPETTATMLHDALAEIGAQMSVEVLETLQRDGKLEAEAQDDNETTYAPMLKKTDGQVHWSQNASRIDCQIRALNPWPGVWTSIDGKRLKILKASPVIDMAVKLVWDKHGEIIDKQGHVFCGDGSILKLETIQPEGKKPMDFASALNGGYVEVGKVFE